MSAVVATLNEEPKIKYLKLSKLVVLIPLPSSKIQVTQFKERVKDEKGEDIEASVSQKEIPTSAYLMAEQSLAPSPVMQTVKLHP